MFRALESLFDRIIAAVEYPPSDIAFELGEGDDAVVRLRPGIDPRPPALPGLEDDEIFVLIPNPDFEQGDEAWTNTRSNDS